MATFYEFPQFCIQEDWNEVFERSEGRVWISVKPYDRSTIRGYLSPNDTAKDGFTLKSLSRSKVTVSCSEGECTFHAPNTSIQVHDKPIISCDISNSGGLGVSGSHDGHMTVWDTSTGVIRRVLEGHVADVTSCQFFPSGVVVLSGSDDMQLRIWSVTDGRCARTLKGHSRRITSTCIVDKGRNVVSTSADGSAKLWDCGSGECIRTICNVPCIINDSDIINDSTLPNSTQYTDEREFATSQKVLLIGCEDGTLKTYDIHNQQMINEYIVKDNGEITTCAFVSETSFICGCENGNVLCFDSRTTMLRWSVTGLSTSSVTSLAAATINDMVVIGYRDGSCIMICTGDVPQVERVLTGPNIDPITSIIINNGMLYTGCRDSFIRCYLV